MRGRTNIGSGRSTEIFADTENFIIAEGSNVTAGNFVQYSLQKNDKKYDTNSGCDDGIPESQNEPPKVLPLGNGRYIRRYKNINENDIFWFNIVDTNENFKILSTISINNKYIPAFCLLNDGHIAISCMDKDHTFTIRVYNIEEHFSLINEYEFSNELVGTAGWVHMTQLGNSKIILTNANKYCVCNYNNGILTEDFFGDFNLTFSNGSIEYDSSREGDNDWNIYALESNKFLLFPFFSKEVGSTYYVKYEICLYDINENLAKLVSKIDNGGGSIYTGYSNKIRLQANRSIWGNAFSINGKVLFSTKANSLGDYLVNAFNTKIYYSKNNYILETQTIDIYESVGEKFFEEIKNNLNTYTTGTVQYVRDCVIYASITPQTSKHSETDGNMTSKTAIIRIEYNEESSTFSISNPVFFEGESNYYFFGFGQFFESESGNVYYLYETQNSNTYEKNGRWLMNLTYENGILSIGESTGFVENYNASGAAIGVAKQSGIAGQTVEVYVPKV